MTPTRHGSLGSLRSTLLSGTGMQALAALAGFIALPMLVRALDSQGFGVLVVIVSLGPWLIVLDMGLSQATRLVTGENRHRTQDRAPAWLLRSARRIALGIATANLVLVAVGLSVAPLERILGSPTGFDESQLTLAVIVFALPIIASSPGAYAVGALEGSGRTVAAVVITSLGPVIVLPLIVMAVLMGAGLVAMCALQGLAVAVPRFVAWGYWHLRPSVASERLRGTADQGLRLALVLQLAAIGGLVMAQTGLAPVIVASQLGADAAASFGLVWRLTAGALIPVVVLTPILGASIASARGRGWTVESDRELRRLVVRAGSLGFASALALVLAGPTVTRWLGGGSVEASRDMFLAGGAFVLIRYAVTPLGLAFSGPRAIRAGVWLNGLATLLALAGSLVATRHLGPAGPLWACAASSLAVGICWLALWRLRRDWLTEVHHPLPVEASG